MCEPVPATLEGDLLNAATNFVDRKQLSETSVNRLETEAGERNCARKLEIRRGAAFTQDFNRERRSCELYFFLSLDHECVTGLGTLSLNEAHSSPNPR